jgi:hypothetical protein
MEKQTARLVNATWGLVAATIILGLATAALVFYTRALVAAEHAGAPPSSTLVKP